MIDLTKEEAAVLLCRYYDIRCECCILMKNALVPIKYGSDETESVLMCHRTDEMSLKAVQKLADYVAAVEP